MKCKKVDSYRQSKTNGVSTEISEQKQQIEYSVAARSMRADDQTSDDKCAITITKLSS